MRQGDSKTEAREARLAAQLRDNLRRRKQQARGAVVAPAATSPDDAAPDAGNSDTDR